MGDSRSAPESRVDNSRPAQLRRWAEKREAKELPAHLLRDAADEIERLRDRVNQAGGMLVEARDEIAAQKECAQMYADAHVAAMTRAEAAEQALADAEPFLMVPSDTEPQHHETLGRVREQVRTVLSACPPPEEGLNG